MSINKNIQFSKVQVTNSHKLTNDNKGMATYDTLCLICAQLNYDFNDSSDAVFEAAASKLESEYKKLSDGESVFVHFGHHLAGRRNAAKPEAKKASSQIQIRCTTKDKALIVRNLEVGENIGSFMMTLAIEEATKRNNKRG